MNKKKFNEAFIKFFLLEKEKNKDKNLQISTGEINYRIYYINKAGKKITHCKVYEDKDDEDKLKIIYPELK